MAAYNICLQISFILVQLLFLVSAVVSLILFITCTVDSITTDCVARGNLMTAEAAAFFCIVRVYRAMECCMVLKKGEPSGTLVVKHCKLDLPFLF